VKVLAMGLPLWGDTAHLSLYHSARGHEVRNLALSGPADYHFTADETVQHVITRIQCDWQPDVLYCTCPELYPPPLEVENCPIKTVAVISDWNLYQPQLEFNLSRFDVVISDRVGATQLRLQDAHPQFIFPIYAHRSLLHRRSGAKRDIDVLFLGNLNHAIHRDRGKALEIAARLGTQYRVVIDGGHSPEEYTRLLNRAHIVLNHSVRGEMNLRCFEAPACGALLFVEAENVETFDWLAPHEECVPYTLQNLDALLREHLEDESLRLAMAEAGWRRIQTLSAERRMDALFDWIARQPSGERPFRRRDEKSHAIADCMLYASSIEPTQRAWAQGVAENLLTRHPTDPQVLLLAAGMTLDRAADLGSAPATRDERRALLQQALQTLNRAHHAAPGECVPLLNLAHAARLVGGTTVEAQALEAALAVTGCAFPGLLIGRLSDPYFAAWRREIATDQPTATLLHAAAAARLAEIALARRDPTGALDFANRAIAQAPTLAPGHLAAGLALLALQKPEEAETQLRAGLPHTAFDAAYRQALLRALQEQGKTDEAQAFARDTASLFRACPPLAGYAELFMPSR